MNKDSRELNSIRNFTVGAVNQVLILFLSLIGKSIFIKALGPVFVGINGLFTNIFLLLSFAEFGIGSVMVYSLYSPITREDKGEVRNIYYFFRKIYISLSIVVTIIGITIIPLLSLIINVEEAVPNLIIYYILYLIGIIISNLYMYRFNLILADQKAYIISLYGLFIEGATMIVQIFVLLKTRNFGLYLGIYIIKHLAYSLATYYKVGNMYPFLKVKEETQEVNEKSKKEIYRKIRDVFAYRFSRTFINGSDNIIISILVGTIWVGYYSNYDLIIVGVLTLVSTFYSAISASVGNLIAKENIESQYNLFETIQILNMWVVGFTSTCLYILFQDFISLWIGQEYLLDFGVVILIILNFYLVCNRKSITIFREASGMFNKIKRAMFLGAMVNIVLSLILGHYMGLFGVLLGTSISTISTYYWYEGKLLMEDKFHSTIKPFIKNQMEALLYTIMSIALTSIFVLPIKDVKITSFIAKMILCLIVPNIFYFIILREKERFEVLVDMGRRNYKRLKGRLRNG